ncbi:MAG: hypothetical protein NVSMB13_04830 [Mycobacteriales bacterium]
MRRRAGLLAVAGLAGLGLLLGLGVGSAWSAFSVATTAAGNGLATGTVYLSDNDAGAAMFALTGMKPADPPSRAACTSRTAARCRPRFAFMRPRPGRSRRTSR